MPESIDVGIGSLNVSISEGITESISKTLPLVFKKLECRVFPEGGYLHNGVINGCYFEASNPHTHDPVDFEADIVEIDGSNNNEETIVGKVETVHEGRGYFTILPKKECEYTLRVTRPSGVTVPIDIPKRLDQGIGFMVQKKLESIDVLVNDPEKLEQEREVTIGLYQREKEIVKRKELLKHGVCELSIPYSELKGADGIIRVLALDQKLRPMAERLIFVPPKETLTFEVVADQQVYSPGDHVRLKVKTSHPSLTTTCCITVTDDSVYKMKEKRLRPPRILAQQYLEHEVQNLYDSDAYFIVEEEDDEDVPPSVKMDLLLGTQGWRRFVFTKFNEEYFKNLEKNGEEEEIRGLKKMMNIEYDQAYFEEQERLKAEEERRAAEEEAKEEEEDYTESEEESMGLGLFGGDSSSDSDDDTDTDSDDDVNINNVPQEEVEGEEEEKEGEDGDGVFVKKKGDPNKYVVEGEGVYTREYVHKAKNISRREDFTETLFYQSYQTKEGENNNIFEIQFDLNDSVSSFCVLIDGFTESGILGFSNSHIVRSLKPFFIEPKVPLELTFGDRFFLPVGYFNNMGRKIKVGLDMEISEGLSLLGRTDQHLSMDEKERKVGYVEMKVVDHQQQQQEDNSNIEYIQISGSVSDSTSLKDTIRKEVRVYPFGFPNTISFSGLLPPNESKSYRFKMPSEDLVRSITMQKFYCSPTPISSLLKGVESLIRRPYGCFEQVSTTLFPMVMTCKLLDLEPDASKSARDLQVVKKAKKFIKRGYDKLIGYECKTGGFSWFGNGEGHESLTAMGILQFSEISAVHDIVGQRMVKRCVEWLFSKMKGGGFHSDKKRKGFFGGRAPSHICDAYILYSISKTLAMSNNNNSYISYIVGFDRKLKVLAKKLEKECYDVYQNDSYFISLVALSLFHFGNIGRSRRLVLEKLMGFQNEESGAVEKSVTSITRSGGEALRVETTALGVLNFLHFYDSTKRNVDLGIQYILSKNRNGRFGGSTQSTVMALEAIVAYNIKTASSENNGSVELVVNGRQVERKHFDQGVRDSILITKEFSPFLEYGKENEIKVSMIDGCRMSFSLHMEYFSSSPIIMGNRRIYLNLSLRLKDVEIREGEMTEIEVILENLNDNEEGVGMVVLVINLPSGLTPRFEKLEELEKSKTIDHFELLGSRKLVFYWTQMRRRERKSFLVDVLGEIPGEFVAMSSFAYLYYSQLESINHVEGLKVKILKME